MCATHPGDEIQYKTETDCYVKTIINSLSKHSFSHCLHTQGRLEKEYSGTAGELFSWLKKIIKRLNFIWMLTTRRWLCNYPCRLPRSMVHLSFFLKKLTFNVYLRVAYGNFVGSWLWIQRNERCDLQSLRRPRPLSCWFWSSVWLPSLLVSCWNQCGILYITHSELWRNN